MIIYLVKSTVLLFLLLVVYKLLLEGEKMHQFNRFFLLFALALGLTAPLISFDLSPGTKVAGIELQKVERVIEAPAEIISKTIAPKPIPQVESPAVQSLKEYPSLSVSKGELFWGIYGLITFLLFLRFGYGLFRIRSTIRSGDISTFKNATLVLVEERLTPQSFLKFIFLNKDEFETGKIGEEILQHEHTHVSQLHSLDVLSIELLKVFFWFNPILYFYKHAIQLNHEFIADDFVLVKGSSVKSYQEALIEACASNRTSSVMTSKFNQSNTRKRLKMMREESSLTRRFSKGLTLAPLLGLILFIFCADTPITENFIPIHKELSFNEGKYYSKSNLWLKYSIEVDSQGKERKRFDGLVYGPDGGVFSGADKYFLQGTKKLRIENLYENGLRTHSTYYGDNENISERHVSNYEDDRLISSFIYDSEGIETQRSIITYENTEPKFYQVYLKEMLWFENNTLDNGLSNYKEYYQEIEQLKFEMFSNDSGYQDLMTLYDEQGNILEQERYQNGELVEKIK